MKTTPSGSPAHVAPFSSLEPLEARIAPATLYALTENQNLLEFDLFSPDEVQQARAIFGIERGDTLLDLDYDVQNATLLGIGKQRIYTIDPRTGMAQMVSTQSHASVLGAVTSLQAEFNPFDGTIRVITDGDTSFRFSRANGALVGTDASLNPPAVDLAGMAFDRNAFGQSAPTLFGFDATTDNLVSINTTTGAVTNVGALGIDVAQGESSFEVISVSEALACDFDGGVSKLYHIDLATGEADALLGTLAGGEKIIGLAVRLPQPQLLNSGGKGTAPVIYGYTPEGALAFGMFAFESKFRGGVRLAQGDVNGDGTLDILAATLSGAPRVNVFDGATHALLHAFTTKDLSKLGFKGKAGVFVTSNDLDGDGTHELILGSGSGRVTVGVFNGATGAKFAPLGDDAVFSPGREFRGGVQVSAGDTNGDGKADIVVGAGPGGPPVVAVFSGVDGSELQRFNAFQPTFKGGVSVAVGDVNGDGIFDILAGVRTKGPAQVNFYNGQDAMQIGFVIVSGLDYTGGCNVTSWDLTGDGRDEAIITHCEGGVCNIEAVRFQVTSPLTPLDQAFLFRMQLPVPQQLAYPNPPAPQPPPPPPPPPPQSH